MSLSHLTPNQTVISTDDTLDFRSQASGAVETGLSTGPDVALEEIRRRSATPNHEFGDHVPGDFERMLERVMEGRGSIRNIE